MLRMKMHDYLKETGASMPGANPEFNPDAKTKKNR